MTRWRIWFWSRVAEISWRMWTFAADRRNKAVKIALPKVTLEDHFEAEDTPTYNEVLEARRRMVTGGDVAGPQP